MLNACGGTTAGIALENGCAVGTPPLRRAISNVAGTLVPRLKFMLRVPPAKVALNPKPQAGARTILSRCARSTVP